MSEETPPVKFGLGMPISGRRKDNASVSYSPNAGILREYATMAERFDFDSIWVTDRTVFQPFHLNAEIALAYIASLTSRVKLGTDILQLGMRDPVMTAKQWASLDYLTGGRMIMGAGLGGKAETTTVQGAVYSGKRMDEMLAMMKHMWTAHDLNFAGKFVGIHGVEKYPARLNPQPVQEGGIPIIVGGGSAAAFRRAATYDGWVNYNASTAESFKEGWTKIQEVSRSMGKDPSKLTRLASPYLYVGTEAQCRANAEFYLSRYTGKTFEEQKKIAILGTAPECIARIKEYIAAGANHVAFNSPTVDLEQPEIIYKEILPAFSRR